MEGLADLRRSTTQLDADNALKLAEQLLVGQRASRLEVGNVLGLGVGGSRELLLGHRLSVRVLLRHTGSSERLADRDVDLLRGLGGVVGVELAELLVVGGCGLAKRVHWRAWASRAASGQYLHTNNRSPLQFWMTQIHRRLRSSPVQKTLTTSSLGTALGSGRGDGTGALGGVEGRALGDGRALGSETDDGRLLVPARLYIMNA